VSVIDDAGDAADITEATPVVLVINPKPKALITGTASICEGVETHAPLTLTFTSGESPWTVIIRRRDNPPYNDTTISNIPVSSYQFNARVIGDEPTLVISIVDDNGCTGDTI
jgi:hypothetical protein